MNKKYYLYAALAVTAFGLYRLYQGVQGAKANGSATGTSTDTTTALKVTAGASRDLYLAVGAIAAVLFYKAR